jgi:geranylgeranyl diphosphate synthase type II
LLKAGTIENAEKVNRVLQLYRDCKVDRWAAELKDKYLQTALKHLDDIAVLSKRKEPLRELAQFLIQRDN